MQSILQPIKEFRDAYDHFIRFLCPNATTEYKIKNLDKALGHEYRAFFDTMDYFCLVMREKIYKLKEGLSIEEIEKRVPHYFKIRQKISKCCQAIAALRFEKDVIRMEKTVERYQEIAAGVKIKPSIPWLWKVKSLSALTRFPPRCSRRFRAERYSMRSTPASFLPTISRWGKAA